MRHPLREWASSTTELLDDPAADAETVVASLHDIARINRAFGGAAAAVGRLDEFLAVAGSGVRSLLDVGTGIGDIPRAARDRAARRGITLRIVGLERHPAAARAALQADGLMALVAEGGRLPFPSRSVDFALCAKLLHHLPGEAGRAVLMELDRVARFAVVVADIRRSPFAAAGIWLASFPMRFQPATRHDGFVSVLRGFSAAELGRRCDEAGVHAVVKRHPGWALTARMASRCTALITIDRRHVRAGVGRVFAHARDVARWPEWLPHYRWVRFHEQRPAGGLVEMAAWRPFGPLNYPTWWLSEMDVETDAPRIRFKHVRGITRGMDVAWEFAPQNGGTDVTITHWWDGPSWPLIGKLAANAVIGPVFVHGIASRTLAGIALQAERGEAHDLQRTATIVVTGVGCVTPIGTGADGLMNGLRAGRSAVRTITRFDPGQFRSHMAAEIPDFRPQDFLESKRARRFDRFSQLSVVAARLALDHAELKLEREDRERIGVMMGSALGGVGFAEEQLALYVTQGLKAVDASLALTVFGGASSCNVAIELGVQGPNSTNSMSCASGTIAVADAFWAIRDGRADVMMAGGAEAPLMPLCYGAFAIIRAMSTRNDDDPASASRPFDRNRDGFVMGEGSAVLVLEERGRALARGAPILAEMLGAASSNDAYHMTAPRPDASQASRCLRLALADAHLEPHEVDYVNAHGSSTPLNDTTETAAFKSVFGDHAYRLAVSGTKGYYGHPLGASGAIEAAVTALALKNEWLPPTINLEDPDPACDLDYLQGSGTERRADVALSNSFGFGGINAAVVMRRGDE